MTNKKQDKILSLSFILIFFVSALGGSASYMINPILPSFLISRGAPMEITGIISSLMSLVALFGRPFVGALSDRVNKKILMVTSYSLSIVCLFLYSISNSVEMIVIVRIINGIAFCLSTTVSIAFGAEFIPISRMGEGISYLGLATIVSTMLGPELGDLAEKYFGLNGVFIWAALLYLICAITTFVLPYNYVKKETKTFKFKLNDFFAFDLWMYVILICIIMVGNGILLYYLKDFGASRNIDNITIFYTVGTVATFLSKPIIGKYIDKYTIDKILFPSLIVTAIFAFIFAKSYALPLLLISAVLKAIGQGTGQSVIQAESVKRLGINKAGVASSTCYIGMDLGNVLGPTIGAYIIADAGYDALFTGYGILLLACIPIYWLYHKKIEQK